MAAQQTGAIIGMIALEDDSKRSMDRLSDSLDRYAALNGPTPDPDAETKPAPWISEWPNRTHAPVIIATCPGCGDSIEANPVNWEIVVDPKSTVAATTVRGVMQHEHDGQVMVRFPVVAAYTPTPVTTEQHDSVADALDEGAASTYIGETLTFEDVESVDESVYLALGAASTCWDDLSEAGVFDDTRAKAIGEALTARIEQHVAERTGSVEAERIRLDQIVYRARSYMTEYEQRVGGFGTTSPWGVLREILAAVDGQDSPAAKRLRRDAR